MKILKYLLYFLIGGASYYTLEFSYRTLLHRGDTHWTMFIIGGFSLMAILLIDDLLRIPIVFKAILGGIAITVMEFILGGFYLWFVCCDSFCTQKLSSFCDV